MESASPQKKNSPPPPPIHVAIIMDGNGRWAKGNGLPRTVGHQRGADAVKEAVKSAISMGIGYLTLFGFLQRIGNARLMRSSTSWGCSGFI